jgi:hypothetical protein
MKHKKFLLITLICLIGIGISFLLFSAHRPFKDLEAAHDCGSQHSVGCCGIRRVNMQAYSFGSLLAQITALRRGAFGERNAPTFGSNKVIC